MLVIPLKDGDEAVINVGDIIDISKSGTQAIGVPQGVSAKIMHIYQHNMYTTESELELIRIDGESWAPGGNTTIRICINDFVVWFDIKPIPKNLHIAKRFIFKDRNLEGMPCKKIVILKNGDYFVELEENVSGCSCDGLGKVGHCIVVKKSILKETKPAKKTKQRAS